MRGLLYGNIVGSRSKRGLWEKTSMSQAYVNKILDVNLSQKKTEDQLSLSMRISNFERPHCLQNKIILTVKNRQISVQRCYVLALLLPKKPDHSEFGPLRAHLH